MKDIEAKVRAWEREVLPERARTRALFELLVPDPAVMAMVMVAAAGVVTGHTWLLWLAIAVGVFALMHMALDARYGVTCETADHWVGDGELPEGMAEVCPCCREIPFRVLWRAGRKGDR